MDGRTGAQAARDGGETLDDPSAPITAPPTGESGDPAAAGEAALLRRIADRDLLLRIQDDDLGAFERFFDRYRVLIHRTAFGLTGDRQVAEEILQDTFLRAYRHRHSLRTDVSPVPWLHRVALNLCYSRLGRRRLPVEPIGETTQEVRDHNPEPADHVEREELRETIRFGIAALPPKHQSVVVLYYLHGMSLIETSAALGIAVGTVKSRLHYALASLRGSLSAVRNAGDEDRPVVPAVEARPVSIVAVEPSGRRGERP